jgi:hypothetical protein
MHNKDIIFDVDNKRIGLVDSNCGGLSIIKNVTYIEDIIVNKTINNYEKECQRKIQYYINALFIVIILAIIIIAVLLYGIYRLKKSKHFLWIKLGENSN